jgi:glyoxylase-like metal-dependent hydrolase (beta-lactamase superfamily II)
MKVLSDGHMAVGLDRLAGNPDDPAVRRAFGEAKLAAPVSFAINVVLGEIGGKRVLFDTGAGGTWVDTAGRLGDDLTRQGVDPKSIDLVVFTHGHADHLWGAIDDFDDSLRFPNATYAMPDAEFLFWMTPGEAERLRAAEGVTAGARRVLKRLEPKLKRIKAGADILPGLSYVDASGHTPGQCAVFWTAMSATPLLIAADTIFHPVISVQHPDWQPAQDMDGARAAKSRRDLLALAAESKALVAAYHVAAPGLGTIERKGTGYTWVA